MARRTPAQLAALRLIAEGGVRAHEFNVRKGMVIIAPGRDRITRATFQTLVRDELVVRDNTTSLFQGQAVTLTAAGRAALPT